MEKRQTLALFVCSLVPWTVGTGLIPLLPVYATHLGANPAVAGLYLAFSYLALAVGALSAGWVSDRLRRRKIPIIAVGAMCVPVAWLMGQVTSVWGLTALTALLWFFGGLGLALISILAGLSVREGERGRLFGLLALTGGLGALVGSLGTGYLVEHWGFSTMFNALAVFLILWPVMGTLLVEQGAWSAQAAEGPASLGEGAGLGRSFRYLFASGVVISTANFVILLVRSLVMGDLGFGAMDIASTGAVGGIVAMPVPLMIGWLSDRRDRKPFLYVSFLAMLASLAALAVSTSLWHFWAVFVLESAAMAANGAVGNALVMDLLPPESAARGLALYSAGGWIGGILGFAGAGLLLQSFGALPTLLFGIGLVLTAIALLTPIHSRVRRGAAGMPIHNGAT
jgi:DHA1 family tetracycline resistance protein-like MFS transporter